MASVHISYRNVPFTCCHGTSYPVV